MYVVGYDVEILWLVVGIVDKLVFIWLLLLLFVWIIFKNDIIFRRLVWGTGFIVVIFNFCRMGKIGMYVLFNLDFLFFLLVVVVKIWFLDV